MFEYAGGVDESAGDVRGSGDAGEGDRLVVGEEVVDGRQETSAFVAGVFLAVDTAVPAARYTDRVGPSGIELLASPLCSCRRPFPVSLHHAGREIFTLSAAYPYPLSAKVLQSLYAPHA